MIFEGQFEEAVMYFAFELSCSECWIEKNFVVEHQEEKVA